MLNYPRMRCMPSAKALHCQLRKIQLKFNSAQDFDAALTALVELGLPSYECFPLSVEEALKAAHLTPTTAAPVVPQTTTSSSGVRREPMPSSAGGHSKALGIGSIGLPISGLPPSEIYFPSDHRSEERHSRLSQRPNTAISGPRSSNTQDLRPSTALPAPVRYGRGAEDFQLDTNMLQPRKSEVLRPRTSFSPAPTNNRNQDEMKSDLPPLPIPTNTSMDGTQGLTLHSSPRKLTQNTSDISNFPRSAPNTVPQTETTSLYFGRPSTAAGAQILSELHAEVPPRRELPFQRQSRPLAGNDALKSLNIPHTSFSALASSKDRNMVPNLTTSAGDAVDGRPAPLTGGLKHTSKAKTVDFVLDVDCPTRIGHYGSTYEALRDCPGNSKLADSQQQNLPAQAEQRLESISATEPLCGPTAKKPGCASDSETHETHIRQVLDRLMPYVGSARTDKESLASYTRLSNKERRTVIEDVVVDLIKDDNFAQLCEDLYGTWQRIGLGP